MSDKSRINPAEIIRQIIQDLPPGLQQFQLDLQHHLQNHLTAKLNAMNLVTRESFDIQNKVLQKTRLKLEALEGQVAALEADFSKSKQH